MKKRAFLLNHPNSHHESSKSRRRGGLLTLPFIIVNESFEKVASYGLLPNMIFYLMNVYHLEAAKGSIILSLWSASSNTLAIFGGFLSDSYLGRFRVIAFGTLCSLLGTVMLWSTSMTPWMKPSPCVKYSKDCDKATSLHYLVLFVSFGLISIGAGCVRPCSLAFGADQVIDKDNPNNERVLDSFFNWYYASSGLSTTIALTITVYFQDQFGWQIGFGLPVIFMLLSLVTFLLGSPLYVHIKVKENLFVGLFQVPVAAYRRRKFSFPADAAEVHYYRGNDFEATTPSDHIRCTIMRMVRYHACTMKFSDVVDCAVYITVCRYLNKACVIIDPVTDLNSDGSVSNPWSLSTVERVERLKCILRILPMWTTGVVMLVALNNSYTTLQAKSLDRHIISGFEIPAGSFQVFSIVTITFWIAFYDRVVVPLMAKYLGMPRGLEPSVRMGIGLLLSCVSLIIAGVVECIRRKVVIDEGLEDKPDAVINMSAMWLAPQLVLLGFAEAFNAVGQIEFYYDRLSKSMSSIAMAIFTLGMAVSSVLGSLLVNLVDTFTSTGGNVSWLSSNLNKGHVDYYYWLVAFMCLIDFLYFLLCCRAYGSSESRGYSHRSKSYDTIEHNSA